jgi:hypothetical protein
VIGASATAKPLLDAAGVVADAGVLSGKKADAFLSTAAKGRIYASEASVRTIYWKIFRPRALELVPDGDRHPGRLVASFVLFLLYRAGSSACHVHTDDCRMQLLHSVGLRYAWGIQVFPRGRRSSSVPVSCTARAYCFAVFADNDCRALPALTVATGNQVDLDYAPSRASELLSPRRRRPAGGLVRSPARVPAGRFAGSRADSSIAAGNAAAAGTATGPVAAAEPHRARSTLP